MDGGDAATYFIGPVVTFLLGGGAVSVYSARRSAKSQVSGDEREARRDTVADRDALYDRLEKRLVAVEERLERTERVSQGRSDQIDVLEAHIWAGKPAPPPARPEGI